MSRVLIVRIGAMGDVLHALPAAAALAAARPDWIIDWVVDERWLPLLRGDAGRGPVDTAFAVPVRIWKKAPLSGATLHSLVGLHRLRGRYDSVVDMQGTLRSAGIGWLAGRGLLSGYNDPRERLAASLYMRRLPRAGTHVVEQGGALLGAACSVNLQPIAAAIPRIEAAEAWADERADNGRLCVLSPRAGWTTKQWPAERFGALAKRLRETGYHCVVNAARADDELAAAVVAASGGAATTAVCDVAGLVALVRRAALLVGGDSGPVHLAAMLGVPVVALFGPTDPERNGPWGPGHKANLRDTASRSTYRRTGGVDAGLEKITVEQVLAAVNGF